MQIFWFLVFVSCCAAQDDPCEVFIDSIGLFQCKITKTRNGRDIENFVGIKYAYPPLRFGPIQNDPLFQDIKWDARQEACIQSPSELVPKNIQVEECLKLSIYRPWVRSHPLYENHV